MPTVHKVITDTSLARTLNNTNADYETGRSAASADNVYAYVTVGEWKLTVPVRYAFERACLLFDTTSIPASATISAAKLQLYSGACYWAVAQPYTVYVLNGQPTYPHNPVVAGDYDRTLYAGNGGSIKAQDVVVPAYNDVALNALGMSWINKGGYTKLFLQSSNDLSAIPPLGLPDKEWVDFSEAGHAGQSPILDVTYTFPDCVAQSSVLANYGGGIL